MAFRKLTEDIKPSFNSAVSCNFKSLYDSIVHRNNESKANHKPSKTFAPSSIRCNRLSFFRLRGIDPDVNQVVDDKLEFQAMLGTACHESVQRNLKDGLGDDWVDVKDYLKSHPIQFEYEISNRSEFESFLKFENPPVRFACDGILKVGDEFYLLEIKTSEYQAFKNLETIKEQHLAQVQCYCSLLNLKKALVLYIDRMYGETKCFELEFTQSQLDEVLDNMQYVMQCREDNIAPASLPKGDFWCTYCKYKKRCADWGR